jgi:hypothetical protein
VTERQNKSGNSENNEDEDPNHLITNSMEKGEQGSKLLKRRTIVEDVSNRKESSEDI